MHDGFDWDLFFLCFCASVLVALMVLAIVIFPAILLIVVSLLGMTMLLYGASVLRERWLETKERTQK